MMTAFDDLRFAVIDVEGNGQQPPEIVEIAITPVEGLTMGEPVTWLVKPQRPIAPIVTRKVHGIRDADVDGRTSFADIRADVLAALGGRTPVAHNAQVEYGVLRRHLPDWSPPVVLDTLRLAKKVWPGLSSYGLNRLLAHANIVIDGNHGQRHRARYDSYATALLFVQLAEAAGSREQLYSIASLPALAAKREEPEQEGLW